MRFETRVVHFFTRIWSGQGDGLVVGSEQWDDKNATPNDGCKTPGSDWRASYTLPANLYFILAQTFSIRFKSRLYADHSNNCILFTM